MRKYICEVTIDLPLEETVAFWEEPRFFSEWKENGKSFRLVSGQQGKKGAKTLIIQRDGKNRFEITETILDNQLPRKLSARYEGMHNINLKIYQFKRLTAEKTLVRLEVDYIKFKTFWLNIAVWILPDILKRDSQKALDNFKELAEKESITNT